MNTQNTTPITKVVPPKYTWWQQFRLDLAQLFSRGY